MTHPHKTALVVGGGPAGLMAADSLARAGLAVTLVERMPSIGRKFLMAGRGGLNLTFAEPLDRFLTRYREAAPRLGPILSRFTPDDLVAFAHELGQETFTGTSGRIFPKAMKASPLLRAWLARLDGLGIRARLNARFAGFEGADGLVVETPQGRETLRADATVFALGGASWPRLGADGGWAQAFAEVGVDVAPLRPSNMGFHIAWSPFLIERFAGTPLKSAAFAFGGETVKGEAMLTTKGLEGGALYALSAPLREALLRDGEATLVLDLKPGMTASHLAARLARPKGSDSQSNFLRKATGLAPLSLALLREAGAVPKDPDAIAARIKRLELRITGFAGLERAISTAGGISFDALDANLMLLNRPGTFVAGEMIDWEAPTGGYLLQACFATGKLAGEAAAEWAKKQ